MPSTVLFDPGEELPPCDARLERLYRYWLAIRPAAHLLPGRCHFEPTAIPRLLRWIWLTDVHRSPLRFRYRLAGTAHVNLMGSNPDGRWYERIHPRFRSSEAYPLFVAAVEDRKASLFRGPPTFIVSDPLKTIERLILPLAHNGRDVDMLLGIMVVTRAVPPRDSSTNGL